MRFKSGMGLSIDGDDPFAVESNTMAKGVDVD
jgi:hypothetical protein